MRRVTISQAGARKLLAMRTVGLVLLPFLAACATAPQSAPAPAGPHARTRSRPPPTVPSRPPPQPFRPPQIELGNGLDSVIQKDATTLTREFGPPRLDVHEGDMRKLQFAGPPCVLDVYLYPLRPGAEPVATHVDARRESDGRDVDRAACIAALAARQ